MRGVSSLTAAALLGLVAARPNPTVVYVNGTTITQTPISTTSTVTPTTSTVTPTSTPTQNPCLTTYLACVQSLANAQAPASAYTSCYNEFDGCLGLPDASAPETTSSNTTSASTSDATPTASPGSEYLDPCLDTFLPCLQTAGQLSAQAQAANSSVGMQQAQQAYANCEATFQQCESYEYGPASGNPLSSNATTSTVTPTAASTSDATPTASPCDLDNPCICPFEACLQKVFDLETQAEIANSSVLQQEENQVYAQCNTDLNYCLQLTYHDAESGNPSGGNLTTSNATTSTLMPTSSPSPSPLSGGNSSTGNATYDACYQIFTECSLAPDVNHPYCAANFAACLGYNPFDTPITTTSMIVPTSTPAPGPNNTQTCLEKFQACETAMGGSYTSCVAAYNACTGGPDVTSTSTLTPTSSPSPSPVTCLQTYLACLNATGSTYSYCAAQYRACTGGPDVTTSTLTPTSSPSPSPVTCLQTYLACLNATGSIYYYCAAQYDTCTGTNPNGNGPHPPPNPNVTYTTEIVTAITTYCPSPTTITTNGATYTVTSATTLTITDCPCTITKPVVPVTAVQTSTPPPTPTIGPSGSTYLTTEYTTLTSFVPCSTPLATSGTKTFYSSWLSVSYSTQSSVSTVTIAPTSPLPTVQTVQGNASPNSPAQIPPVQPSTTVIPPAAGQTCPTTIVYSTVFVTATASPTPAVCTSCYTETTTITLSNGYTTCLTITASPTSMYVPGQSQTWSVSTTTIPNYATGAVVPTGFTKSGSSKTVTHHATGAVRPTNSPLPTLY